MNLKISLNNLIHSISKKVKKYKNILIHKLQMKNSNKSKNKWMINFYSNKCNKDKSKEPKEHLREKDPLKTRNGQIVST